MPKYESPEDLANEIEVSDWLAEKYRLAVIKTKTYFPVDFAVYDVAQRCRVQAVCEIKCRRDYTMERTDELGGYMLSLHKWGEARTMSVAGQIPFWLVVRDSAQVVWRHIPNNWQHDGVRIMGRTDRNNPDDIEPCVLLRMARFERLGTL